VNRRTFLGLLGAAAVAPSCAPYAAKSRAREDAVFSPFDREVEAFMSARNIPGSALAVVKDKRLVYARGYGWADRQKQIAATPNSLFRIASLSKPITAVAVLKLVEAGKLDLDARAFDLVRMEPVLDAEKKPDPRLERITVRQLLQHTGGWDRDRSFDPMFRPGLIARKVGVPAPAGPEAIIRYMLGQPLDFDPGARFAYSNFGYCVLGRVIERISGQSYEKFVQEKILARLGIERMRIGASLDGRQAPGEVHYYTADNSDGKSVFPTTPLKVPWPYGGFHLEAMDAHGGWIASAVDLARFAAALDESKQSPLLKPAAFRIMQAPPAAPVSRKRDGSLEDRYYGCGWMVRPVGGDGKANYWHSGSLPGTATLLQRRWDGLSWVVLFNQRSEDKKLPDGAIEAALHRAADSITEWPQRNLFSADI
jgi:N-acyl-D-amino-acid deacylase